MFAIHLKAMVNVESKIVDSVCTCLLEDCFNLFSDGYLQCSNGMRVALVDVVLEEPLDIEI